MKKTDTNAAFTLVETLVAFFLATALIVLLMQLSGGVRTGVVRGDVDLQNLMEARAAINSIRRDFLVATPRFEARDGIDMREQIRHNPVVPQDKLKTIFLSSPVTVAEHALFFCRQVVDEAGNQTSEEVSYTFDESEKTLVRTSPTGVKKFAGIENSRFSIYFHPLKPEIPMVWVSITVKNIEGGESRQLEIATTIASSIISQDLNNLHWNWNPQ